jgi:hypothetical protein
MLFRWQGSRAPLDVHLWSELLHLAKCTLNGETTLDIFETALRTDWSAHIWKGRIPESRRQREGQGCTRHSTRCGGEKNVSERGSFFFSKFSTVDLRMGKAKTWGHCRRRDRRKYRDWACTCVPSKGI